MSAQGWANASTREGHAEWVNRQGRERHELAKKALEKFQRGEVTLAVMWESWKLEEQRAYQRGYAARERQLQRADAQRRRSA